MTSCREILELFRWRNDLAATTGADGRFRLTGIGRERVVSLWIEGPTIATSFVDIHARTRPGPTYRLALQRDKPEYGTLVFHGATFDHRGGADAADRRHGPRQGHRQTARGDLDPERSLRRQCDQRQRPRADDHRRRRPVSPGGDARGSRQRDHGQPRPGTALPGSQRRCPRRVGPEPATVDFALKRGVAIRGKVSDKATGKPVPAVVEYFVFVDNPHRDEARRLHGGEVPTRPDGSFELVGLPGRGLVAARAAKDHYLVGQGADKIAGADENGWFRTDPHFCVGAHPRDRRDQARRRRRVADLRPGPRPGNDASRDRGRPRRQAAGGLRGHRPLPPYDELQHGQAHLRRIRRDRPRSETAAAPVLPPRREEARGVRDGQGRRERAADRPPPARRHRHRPPDRRRRPAPDRQFESMSTMDRASSARVTIGPA